MASIIFGDELNTLKNLFTLNRYAEDYYFGRSDIERWLAKEKKSEIPDMETWKQALYMMHKPNGYHGFIADEESATDVLSKIGFPIRLYKKTDSDIVHFKDVIEWHSSIFGVFGDGFLSYDGILFLVSSAKGGILLLNPGLGEGGVYSDDCLHVNIAYSALLSWYFLDDERAEKAKEYLCDWLKKCIEKVCSDAEVDFDRAVAVSEDGAKITHADCVLLYDVALKKNVLYKGDEFKEQKVLRDDFFSRHNATPSNIFSLKDDLIKYIRHHPSLSISYEVYTQTYFSFLNVESGNEETCLFAQIDSDFPEGGIVL